MEVFIHSGMADNFAYSEGRRVISATGLHLKLASAYTLAVGTVPVAFVISVELDSGSHPAKPFGYFVSGSWRVVIIETMVSSVAANGAVLGGESFGRQC